MFALKWNDLDWEKGTLRVDESYFINDNNLYEDKRPKSENGIRVVAVPEYLMNLLEQLRKSKFGPDKQIEIGDSIRNMHKEKDKKKETRLISD